MLVVVDDGRSSSSSSGGDGSGSRNGRGMMHVVIGVTIDIVVVEGLGIDVAWQLGFIACTIVVDRSLMVVVVNVMRWCLSNNRSRRRGRGSSLLLLYGIKKRNLGHL